ncbi:chromosome partitioning protein [Colwellia chukchiensis]|uniref:Chromosome partitioning protein n=1 Tax=Colwellia chukchiensis TaxID=641665 RepID=A0A1H7TZ12_9GAMM|nr:ParA family protein [Colwellia chukchiensis]SEL89893.1 chromosome partitioning protein [Colwellia chukchiensis]
MTDIIGLANSKGGVAKTTSCLAIGTCLAELGYSTLLMDLDHQANLSDDVERGDEDYTITDLFEDPKFDLNQCVYPAMSQGKEIPNLDVVPADITLATTARSAERHIHRHQILSDGIKKLKKNYDFILIDCRPAIDLSIECAFLVADLLIVPVDMDRRATKGILDLFETVKEVKRVEDFNYLLVKTKVDTRNKIMLRSTDDRIEQLGLKAAKAQARTTELYKQATDNKVPVTHFAPNSRAHDDYKAITNEILDEMKIKGPRFEVEVVV